MNSLRTIYQVDIDGVPQAPGQNGHNPAKLTRLKQHSVAAVARDVGVGWATLMAAVVDYGTPLIERPDRIDGVAAVGVDETAFLRARPARSTVFATGIIDLHGGKLIYIIEGRSRKVLADWLIDQPTLAPGWQGCTWRRREQTPQVRRAPRPERTGRESSFCSHREQLRCHPAAHTFMFRGESAV